jgi:diacylglycerol kinase (ATP)
VPGAVSHRRFEQGDRIVVIANPATRAEILKVYNALMRRLPAGIHLEVQETRAGENARSLALRLREGTAGMVAVGGDGTVSSVAAALHGTDIPLGIIPGGSTNIIARELGIPSALEPAVQLLFDDFAVRQIDVGVCNDNHFLHMAGAGFDSRLFDMADPALKKRIGWVAYLPAAIKALRDPARKYRLVIDGERIEVESPLVLVANGSSVITPRIRIGADIRPDDGQLDVMVVTATRPHELASVLGRFASLTLDSSPYVIYRKAKKVVVESDKPIPVQLDGDVMERTPATFSVLPHDIGIIVPRLAPGR